jgi:dCMP deaminase
MQGLRHINGCPFPLPCTRAIHAEANAIIHAAKYGVGVDGAELHTTRMPCLNCAGMILNAGIKRVVYYEDHREESGLRLLQQAGLEVVKYVYG